MLLLAEFVRRFARRFGPWLALAALAVMIALVAPAACRKMNGDAARARLGDASATAASGNGRDAVATVGAAARRERQSADLTQSNEKEIRNAQGADVPLDPAVRDAGLGSLCRRPAYRDSERCRMRRPAPR